MLLVLLAGMKPTVVAASVVTAVQSHEHWKGAGTLRFVRPENCTNYLFRVRGFSYRPKALVRLYVAGLGLPRLWA